jgi:diacylglycerol kinase family enzyme
MATNGGLGLGSLVAQSINSIRKRHPLFKRVMKLSGKNIYGLFIVRELMSADFAVQEYAIECDEFKRTVRSAAVLVNNQPVLAGMFRIAPQTDNADGKFNVTILAHQRRQDLIRCILQIASGNLPKNDPDLISFETEKIQIRRITRPGDAPLEFFGDGEILGQSDTWYASIDKAALRVYSRRREYGDQLGVRAQSGPSLDLASPGLN